jgi:nucleotidyltransferase substrate binding protein (TIGR01987 family)
MQVQELTLTPLTKAIASLEDALSQPFNPYTRDASIQRFEYTFELAWKLLQRYLKTYTTADVLSVKDLFREAARLELIDAAEPWFEFLAARNLTSHTSNENTANETYSVAVTFLPAVKELLNSLEARL